MGVRDGDSAQSVILLTRAVDMAVVAIWSLVLNMGRVNGNTTSLLLRRLINLCIVDELASSLSSEDFCNRSSQGGLFSRATQQPRVRLVGGVREYRSYLSVINVPNGTDIHVRFCSREFRWGVCVPSSCGN